MASGKYQYYAQMADQTARQLTGSLQAWTGFLATAARLYKYPYHEQLMIYAQRPEATACADYDLWNKTMRRYVRRGSQGIALIDTSGDNPRLKYVFDVSDTGGGEQSRRPYLWEYRDEHYDAVTAALERRFDVAPQGDLADQLETIATQLVNEYWQDNQYDILGIVDGSFLSEYDDFNVGAAFRNAAVVSTTYALLSRCGLEPEEYFTHEDFLNVFDFNTPSTVAALGTAVSVASEQVLRQIEVTIKNYEREKNAERSQSHDRADLSEERRLPDPEPDAGRAGAGSETPGQVWEDSEEIPAGASPGAVESDDPERNPVPAPAGDRRGGNQPDGADDPDAGEGGRGDGVAESQRPAEMDRPDEHLQGPGGGNDPDRAGVRVIDEQPFIETAEQFSLFPTEAEQIAIITEAESAPAAPFAFSLPQEAIDQLLRVGSNTEDARTKLTLEFMKQKPLSELTAFVKQTYHDGYGLQTGSGSISSWAADDGLHITRGTSVRYARTAQVLSWEDATARIGELLEQGRFASNVELVEAPGYERRQVAQSLWYLCQDMSDTARDGGWLPIIRENYKGGFPEATERLSKLLEDPKGRQSIMDELTLFAQAWREDASLMRFRLYRPDVMLERVAELGLARREYPEGMTELPAQRSFITEDEIDATLSRGGSFEGGAGRIYSFWQQEHTPKEKADFLKNEYGTGGGNGTVSRNFDSWEDHSSKGIVLKKPFAEDVNLSWAKVAKRIDALVSKDRYLTPEGKAAWEKAQAENAARSAAVNEYNAIKEAHPDDIVLFQVGDFFEMYGEDAKTAAKLLDFNLTTRNIPGVGRVEMCGVPSHQLDFYLEKLRDTQDAVVASISTLDGKHTIRVVPSIDHEAAQAIDAHEAEFGADGYRAFPGDRPEKEAASAPEPAPAPLARKLTQEDIDQQLRTMFPDIETKRAVVRYMNEHGREKETAAWLASQYYGTDVSQPLHIGFAGREGQPGGEVTLSWPKVQRRIAQLIKADKFYTQEEYDNLGDVDPIAIREHLAQAGIVNGELVDPEALDRDPFIQQVMADAERIAQEEQEAPTATQAVSEPAKRPGQTRVERNYRAFARQFPEIVSGEYRYLELRSGEGRGLMPLTIQRIGENEIAVAHTYEQDGDLMYDPEMTFHIDTEKGTLEPLTFRQDGGLPIYQEVYPEPGKWIPKLRSDLSAFTDQWLKNIEEQGRVRYRAIAVRDGEDVEIAFDGNGQPVLENTDTSEERQKQIKEAFRDARLEYDDIDSYDGYLIFRDEGGVAYTFLSWDEAAEWINGVVFDDPERDAREPLPLDGNTVSAEKAGVETPETEATPVPEDRDTEATIPSKTGDYSPYSVGDTVYLENTAYEITAIGDFDVQLRDPTQRYPVFRSESKERLATELYRDPRNFPITDYLAANLDRTSGYLRDALTWDGGLLDLKDKEQVSELFRNGAGNARVASFLAASYGGKSIEMTMPSGDVGILHADIHALDLRVNDQGGPVSISRTSWESIAPILRAMFQQDRNGFFREPVLPEPETGQSYHEETVAVYPGEKNGLPYDIVIQTIRTDGPEHDPPTPTPPPAPTADNFRITDDHLGEGGPKAKFRANMDAIYTLKTIENEGRGATPEEQETLSRYVGWGGLADAFDPDKREWSCEYKELQAALTDAEYTAARASTLNAHYTTPTVIRAIYEAVGNMGFRTGNILEPAMGVGNFFGMLPEEMRGSRLYGVELDSISGRIAKQLYPKANITVAGFETTDRRDFYDLAVGNVPFGNYQVDDRAYNKLGFTIHNYFFAKALDQVRPGGVVAFVTSRYTMDAKDPTVRKYLAQRAELLGAIRLPNNAFRANAGTDVVSDIIFLQKRDHPIDTVPEWVYLGENDDGFSINSYFVDHPEMILGRQSSESTQYGHQDFTVLPIEGLELGDQLHDAIKYIRGTYEEAELPELGEGEEVSETLPADPDVKNYSFTVVDGEVYYRENSIMVRPDLNATAKERVKGMVELRDCVRSLIDLQMDEYTPDSALAEKQAELNRLYDAFTAKYGLINDRGNRLAFADDDSYYLLCSLEVLDENGELERKADFFTKRTIKQSHSVDHVDTAVEALGVSIGERACVDLPFMASLMGGQEKIPQIVEDLRGVIYKDPSTGPFDYAEGGDHWSRGWQAADEYLSGNVRRKLRRAERAAEQYPEFQVNVEALRQAQPKDLEASEIEVRLGTTWIDKEYFQQFMYETFDTPFYLQRRIQVHYSPITAEWQIEGKSNIPYNNIAAYTTFGTDRASAYRLLEDALNLRDTRIYDTVTDPDGKERRVLNAKETTLAAQKQQLIKDAFKDWVWKDPERRAALVKQYNEEMNSTRPREYDGSHIVFSGMNPEITLRPHQRDAIAHVLYGGNTLLAHEVGAGKTFEMVAAAMESKRLGLCSKSIFVVPNHLTDQWAAEFLRLYPSANILVTTKKDFQKHNRKKFCARIATGNYDAVIIGHSQFEKIPISPERQIRLIEEQIDEITNGIEEVKENNGERFTIKELERTKKGLEARLKKLQDGSKKDDVVTFEQLGVDRMFVDESDNYKNLFLYTKMRNVAGLSTTDAQKSSDMFAKCRYMDELTGGRGVVFATGTPVSNSMTELYTIQRYLQYDRLQELGMGHFDCWASRFGETTTALELAPEGTGYRARTRFAKFFNLPELMNLFKEVADIKTADQLDLPTPEVEYHNFVSKPTEIQKEMVKDLSERASRVHSGTVDAHIDNMLKITSDGRKLGLDQRIINPMLPDEDGTKVNQCVGNILQFWRDGEDQKLTQLVFCDISTPKGRTVTDRAAKAPGGILDNPELHALETLVPLEPEEKERPFTIYEDIRQKLMQGGMPEEQIAFIHDADTEVRKRELFAKVRSGQVRVLIGSTQKMGAGTNVQDRLIALHDLDCPWRPRDLTQRKGRIERQGNQNELVHVCRYVTEGTFDAYLWQTVENKQKFISQIMTSKSPVRSCEDIDETALSFAEIKALCAGDPRIKERMDLDVEVSKLKIMKADHQSKQYRLEDQLLKYFPEQIEQNKGFIRGFEADMKTMEAHPLPQEGFIGMVIRGDNLTDKENAGAALIDAAREVKSTDPVEIGSYRGFSMSVEFSSFTKGYMLTLKGEMTHRVELGEDPRGNLTRIDNILAKMPERLTAVQTQLDNLYQQQAAAKAEVGKPFPYEQELTEKTARLVELDTQLNLNGGKLQPQPEQVVAKQDRPSILERLKQPLPQKAISKHKSHTLEASL